jgi:uncharacterized cupin superfamily protein
MPDSAKPAVVTNWAPDALTAELEDWGPIKVHVAGPVAHLYGRHLGLDPANGTETGIWECTPGTWRRQVTQSESCTFIKGHAIFHADSGEKIDIRPGTAIFFPANTTGIWEVQETVRKVYMTVEPRKG